MASSIFAKLFRWPSRAESSESELALPRNPAPEETTARYLFERGHFSPENSRVRPRALEPARQDHKTSVYRIVGLPEREVWRLGERHVEPARGKPILARADLSVAAIHSIGLVLEPHEPPVRHANIAGWPGEKDVWKSKAQELAALAQLKLKPV